jgi:hypothetical protein
MNKKIFSLLTLAFSGFLLSACTTQNWYEGVKSGALGNCNTQPGQARQDCLDRLNKQSYEKYEKERAAKKPE